MGRKGKGKGPSPLDLQPIPGIKASEWLAELDEERGLQQAMADAAKEAEEHGGIAKVLTEGELLQALDDDGPVPEVLPHEDEDLRRIRGVLAEAREAFNDDEWPPTTPLENVATAPTVQCTDHVAACAKCGVPLTGTAYVTRAPDGTWQRCCVVEISQLWQDRLEQLCKRAGKGETEFVEDLIKRQWVASGGGRG